MIASDEISQHPHVVCIPMCSSHVSGSVEVAVVKPVIR